ncbi:unnamed protein product, partial [marine sediment metagenome]
MAIDLEKIKKKIEGISTHSGKLELMVLDSYVNFMKNKKGQGKIEDIKNFKLSVSDGKALSAEMGELARGYFLNNYLMVKGEKFDVKQYDKKILDEITGQYLGINEKWLKANFDNQEELTPGTMNNISSSGAKQFTEKEQERVLAPIGEADNHDAVSGYI